MKDKFKGITKINSVLTILFLGAYFIINLKKYFFIQEPRGDEHFFIEVYNLFLNQGFYEANVYGNSTLFNLISSIFYKLGLSPLYSLKCTALFSGIATMVLIYYIGKRLYGNYNKEFQLVALLTACNVLIVVISMFGGINDPLLVVLFLLIVYTAIKKKHATKDFIYIGILIALMFATRKFTVLLLPSIGFLLFIIIRKQANKFKKIASLLISCVLVAGIFNYPSLKENGTLSFNSKERKEYKATWAQLQYYTQILLEKGEVTYGSHTTWEATDQYLKENGEESLPDGIIEGLLFDVKRTVKEFFIDFVYNIKPFTRLLGIIFLLNIIIFGYKLIRKKLSISVFANNPIDTFSLLYILILSLIVITYVEIRWFVPILVLLPIVFMKRIYAFTANFKNVKTTNFLILNLQMAAINIMSLPFIINNYAIIF